MATLKVVTGKFTGPDGVGIPCSVKAVLSAAVTIPGTQEIATPAAKVASALDGNLTPNTTKYVVTATGQVDSAPVTTSWQITVPQTAGPFEISNILS